ncbi:MAG: UDP-N-acetylmuramoyl-L-alanine--D-glutamate ligase [Actinomycetes bacterium]
MSRRVLVVGLRMTGVATARALLADGDSVTVVEERPGQPGYADRAADVRAAGATVVEAPDPAAWPDLVGASDLVVPSPGVAPGHPALEAAAAAGVPVRGDVDLAVEAAGVPVCVVTGTNGKTTVTTLIAAMLEASGRRAPAAGNIGWALLDAVRRPMDVLVAEVSSFQLHTTTATFAPRVAVLLNVADDHLDWHGSFDAYAEAKARCFRSQGPDDLLVYNADDPVVARLAAGAPGRRVACSTAPDVTEGYRIVDDHLVTADGEPILAVTDLPMRAPHDLANALAASAAALELGATPDGVRAALRSATRLHHRVEPIGETRGVRFIDDSKATNPHATLTALAGFDRSVLIAGGRNKGLDLGVLRGAADRLVGVVAIGDAAGEVEVAFAGTVPTVRADSMRAAVRAALDLATPGDVVLLSPACASFDWYRSYEERGDDFRSEVEALIAERTP